MTLNPELRGFIVFLYEHIHYFVFPEVSWRERAIASLAPTVAMHTRDAIVVVT